MKSIKLILSAVLAAGTWLAAADAVAADVNVRLVHVDQNPETGAFYNDLARRFESTHPGVKVEIQYLENESYKKKLTTLLQSPDRPNILYSWGGGAMRDQMKAGVLEDLSVQMDAKWRETFMPAAVQAFTINGKLYGVPLLTNQVGFFYNKDLFAKAGIDAGSIKTWADFLGAVKKLKDSGTTPIVIGGGDKWPVNLYWAHLALRIGGQSAFEAAMKGDGKGFASDTFVQAGVLFQQLTDLKPFQPGYLGSTFPQSSGQFGDGKGAMVLQINVLLGSMKANSANKIGVPEDKLGWFPFPIVAGGKGNPSDTLGGMNGWLVTKGSPKEAVEFLRFMSEAKNQRLPAERGLYIPVVTAAQDAVANPILRQLAANVAVSKYHQIFYDQMLGASVGQVVNDISSDLATGKMKPAEAAAAVQAAWQRAQSAN